MERRRVIAASVSGGLLCAAFLVLGALVERPFWRARPAPGRELRAAVAIRDDVTPFQKWGTEAFTLPYLRRYYHEARYFTEGHGRNTKEAFERCLSDLLARHEAVDIYLLAHTNSYVGWVEGLDRGLTSRIRLVYNTGCWNSPQADRWLALGARTYVGHPGRSESPPFCFYFLRRWTAGWPVGEAVGAANALAARAFERAGRLSGGRLDAERLQRESVGLCFGRTDLTIGGGTP